MQDQLTCSGCKRVLQYRRGATGVCCPSCNTFTAANPSGLPEMSELVCSGCFTMLMYNRGAANIRCPHCSRVNSTRSGKNLTHANQLLTCKTNCSCIHLNIINSV
jgi:LSD1 subclass zinc finger protein